MDRSEWSRRASQFVSQNFAGTIALGAIVSMLSVLPVVAEEPAAAAKVIRPEEARQHVGKQVTVQFRVQHAKAASKPDRVYLDSEKDYRAPKNLGVLIEADALPAFAREGIAKPAGHYDGKSIRITGKVFLRDDNVFIRATSPKDIEVLPSK